LRFEIAGIERLPPRKCQQLKDQVPRLVDRLLRSVEQGLSRMSGGDFLGQRLEIEIDCQQHVVEFMRDAAGYLAQRFHFLHMARLLFVQPDHWTQERRDLVDIAQ
jgi:hypothetical protein